MSAGKGDARRPTNNKVYGENYDKIFRKDSDASNKKKESLKANSSIAIKSMTK